MSDLKKKTQGLKRKRKNVKKDKDNNVSTPSKTPKAKRSNILI